MRNALNNISVLIVDDQQFARDVIRRTLAEFGYRDIAHARDGEEALEAIAIAPPDIILCDIEMKPMDGFTFLQKLRELPHPFCAVPVIILTAVADQAFIEKARAMQVVRYLMKTSLIEKLDPTIRQVIGTYWK